MGVMLRRLDNRRRWDKVDLPWLGQGEIPADPMADLKTNENKLSVYYVEKNQSNLNDVIEAIAATRNFPDRFDYLLFDEEICSELKIEVRDTKGETPNEEVNKKWHRDLAELSADKLLELAKVVYEKGETHRELEKEMLERVAKASLAGKIPIKDLKPNWRQRVTNTRIWKASSSSQ